MPIVIKLTKMMKPEAYLRGKKGHSIRRESIPRTAHDSTNFRYANATMQTQTHTQTHTVDRVNKLP